MPFYKDSYDVLLILVDIICLSRLDPVVYQYFNNYLCIMFSINIFLGIFVICAEVTVSEQTVQGANTKIQTNRSWSSVSIKVDK